MNEKQARQLLPGTIVMWDNDPADLGTVREIGIGGALVDWENGQAGWIDYKGFEKVSIR